MKAHPEDLDGSSNDIAAESAAHWCIRLSEGSLDPSEHTAFQAWLNSEPAHSLLFEQTVVAWMAVEDQAAQSEMLKMRSAALDSVHRLNGQRGLGKLDWRQLLAIAASMLIMVAIGTWVQLAPTTYETGIGERRVITLADGSNVSLDAATRVDVRFRGNRRELWLDHGRAKFKVAKDALRPFSVVAGQRMVVATGTEFSVERIASEIRVILYEGHVAVLNANENKVGAMTTGPAQRMAERLLVPGRELVLSDLQSGRQLIRDADQLLPMPTPAATLGRIAPVDLERSLEWESGLLRFTNEPLDSAVERMNRYGALPMSVDKSVRSIMISGQFRGDNTDAFVEGVTSVFAVKAVRRADGVIELQAARP